MDTSYNFKNRKLFITNNIDSNLNSNLDNNKTSCYEFKLRKHEINNKMVLQNLTEFPLLNSDKKEHSQSNILCYDKLKETLNKEDVFIENTVKNKKHFITLPLPPTLIPQYVKESYDWSISKYHITFPTLIV
jgi:hypothetical protein